LYLGLRSVERTLLVDNRFLEELNLVSASGGAVVVKALLKNTGGCGFDSQ
jgi:hypothetical protein